MNFFYGRVSTDSQREACTIDTQVAALDICCRSQAIEVPTELRFLDDGFSGKIFLQGRPSGGRLLKAIREAIQRGESDVRMYCWDLERLSRDAENAIQVTKELLKLGIKIVTLDDDKAYSNSADAFYDLGMRAIQGEYDHAKIRRKTMAGRVRVAGDGNWVGGPTAYGYTLKPKLDHRERSVLILNDAQIPGFHLSYTDVVMMIFERTAKGASNQAVVDHLNGLGLPAHEVGFGKRRKGFATFWRPTRIHEIVTNPIYKGDNFWNKRRAETTNKGKRDHLWKNPKEAWVHQKVPAIVSEALWAEANRSHKDNRLTAMAHAKHDFLLRRMIRCGLCGRRFIGASKRYVCIGRESGRQLYRGTQRCTAVSVPRTELDAIVMGDIESFLAKPGSVIKQLRAKLHQAEAEDHSGQQYAQMEAQRQRLIAQDQGMVTMLRKGLIDEADYRRERTQIQTERQAIEKLLADHQQREAEQKSDVIRLHSVEQLLKDLRSQVDEEMSFQKRRDLVTLLVNEIVIQADGTADIVYEFEQYRDRFKSEALGNMFPRTQSVLEPGAKLSPQA